MSSRQPHPEDEDTGPLHVGEVRPPQTSQWEPRYDAPMSVNPRPVQRDRRPVVMSVAAVAGIVVLGIVVWVFWPSSDSGDDSDAATTSTTQSESPPEAEARLLGMLPPGYPEGSCEAVVPVNGALAQVSCDKNADPGGPLAATYTLAGDDESLKVLFDEVLSATSVVNCPGNIQSPVLCPTGVSKTVCGIGSARMGATAAR